MPNLTLVLFVFYTENDAWVLIKKGSPSTNEIEVNIFFCYISPPFQISPSGFKHSSILPPFQFCSSTLSPKMIQSAANMDFTSFLVVILVMVFCAVAVSKLTDLLAEDLSPPKWSGPNYPILGHLPAMIPYSKAFKAHAFFYRVLQESGPVVTVNMFTRKVVVTSNADAAKQILTNGDYFCIRPTFLQEKFEGIAKNALFVLPSGEIWRKHRKLLQPAFGPAHLRHAFDATMSFSRVLFDKVWNQHVESDTPFNVHRHMSCLTAGVCVCV